MIATGVTENDELIRQDLSRLFDLVVVRLAAFFSEEKAVSRLAPDTSENELADFCIAAAQGAVLMGKIARDSQPVESALRVALARVETDVKTPVRGESSPRDGKIASSLPSESTPLAAADNGAVRQDERAKRVVTKTSNLVCAPLTPPARPPKDNSCSRQEEKG
jgi:hypothetical protein